MTYKAIIASEVEIHGKYCSGKIMMNTILSPKDTTKIVFNKMAVVDAGVLYPVK